MRQKFSVLEFFIAICILLKQINAQISETILFEITNNLNILQHHEEQHRSIQQEFTRRNAYEIGCSEWVLEINGNITIAQAIANSTNSRLLRKMKGDSFDSLYLMEHCDNNVKQERRNVAKNLSPDSTHTLPDHNEETLEKILSELKQVGFAERQELFLREKRFVSHRITETFNTSIKKYFGTEHLSLNFNDPMFRHQWQLQESYASGYNEQIRLDHRISDVWKMGITGKGDDGIDYTHDDLAQNYDINSSIDLIDNDNDPMPSNFDELNSHGTRCAGEIAMVANNSICGVGVAYNSKIGGIRILDDGKLNDRMEAEAFTFALSRIDIRSISWGPKDDGKTVEKPGHLAQLALRRGVTMGRNGLGSIYVWASGNGGMVGDHCGCDGYANAIETFTISAVASDGSIPWYSERCSSTLVSTYSTGLLNHGSIVTTNPQNICTLNHTGTSAATPIAVGIIALGLEANPKLGWRDIQHIAVWTANPIFSLQQDNIEWIANKAGLLYNPYFGFGLMDAFEFVNVAKSWTNVPPQRVCTTKYKDFKTKIFSNSIGQIRFNTSACKGEIGNELRLLEHVQLVVNIKADRRGEMTLMLQSPEGTVSELLGARPLDDDSTIGFKDWPFTTVQMWGERPHGIWTFYVKKAENKFQPFSTIHVKSIELILYGTYEAPYHYLNPRNYNWRLNKKIESV